MINQDLNRVLPEIRPVPIVYTVDDLEFMPEDDRRYEVIGGKLFVSRAPRLDHQIIVTNFIVAFGEYLKKNPIGKFVTTPGVIFSPSDAVIPDLVFATRETIKKSVAGKDEKFEGKFVAAPELLIEILSFTKKDMERDRVYKRDLYGSYGVKEYWVVDGLYNTIEVYRLDDGRQKLVKRFAIDESIETPLLPDFELRLVDIFRS